MKTLAIFFSSFLLLSACSSEPNVVLLRTEKKHTAVKPVVQANRLLTLEVEGMTCEMGCGGSIRKELKATDGVERVEFNFVEGKKIQTAKISFDKDKISADKMVTILTSMNDKQFKVGNIRSEAIANPVSTESVKANADSPEKIKISTSTFALPNLMDILSRFVH
jgi:copper chaperone CopZ